MPVMGTKGQVVIPAKLRQRYGLKPGMEVEVKPGKRGPELEASLKAIRALQGKYKGIFTMKEFLAERQRERQREEDEFKRLLGRRRGAR